MATGDDTDAAPAGSYEEARASIFASVKRMRTLMRQVDQGIYQSMTGKDQHADQLQEHIGQLLSQAGLEAKRADKLMEEMGRLAKGRKNLQSACYTCGAQVDPKEIYCCETCGKASLR
jgi:hypothetical protein